MAAPSQRRALGTLFFLLGIAFAGVAFAAAAADSGGVARWLIAVAALAIAIWFLTLSVRALRAGSRTH